MSRLYLINLACLLGRYRKMAGASPIYSAEARTALAPGQCPLFARARPSTCEAITPRLTCVIDGSASAPNRRPLASWTRPQCGGVKKFRKACCQAFRAVVAWRNPGRLEASAAPAADSDKPDSADATVAQIL